MNHALPYTVRPNPRGGYTTRAALSPRVTGDQLDNAVATETGLSPEQCRAVIRAYLRHILAAAASGRWARDLWGMLGFQPRTGGSRPGPGDFHTAEDLNAGVTLAFTAALMREWRATLRITSQGLRGLTLPEMTHMLDTQTRLPGHYRPGGLIEYSGHRLKFDPSDPAQGIFLSMDGSTWTRCDNYGPITPQSGVTVIPPHLHGPLTLRVTALINGSLRSHTHTSTLQQLPAT